MHDGGAQLVVTRGRRPAGRRRVAEDWHRADIAAVLKKVVAPDGRPWTLRRLSVAAGYCADACVHALRKPWPAVERIIADTLGLPPATIWPSRYDSDGQPIRRTRHAITNGRRGAARNGKDERAA